jgi:hypothetical protein
LVPVVQWVLLEEQGHPDLLEPLGRVGLREHKVCQDPVEHLVCLEALELLEQQDPKDLQVRRDRLGSQDPPVRAAVGASQGSRVRRVQWERRGAVDRWVRLDLLGPLGRLDQPVWLERLDRQELLERLARRDL